MDAYNEISTLRHFKEMTCQTGSLLSSCYRTKAEKVKVGNDQEMAQSERNYHSNLPTDPLFPNKLSLSYPKLTKQKYENAHQVQTAKNKSTPKHRKIEPPQKYHIGMIRKWNYWRASTSFTLGLNLTLRFCSGSQNLVSC